MTIAEKERIAQKANDKEVPYPACTAWWNELPDDKKGWIKSHCEKKHGSVVPEWTEGNMFSE